MVDEPLLAAQPFAALFFGRSSDDQASEDAPNPFHGYPTGRLTVAVKC